MQFYSAANRHSVERIAYPCIILVKRNWDDYTYRTTFDAYFAEDAFRDQIHLGSVKILQRGVAKTVLPTEFSSLSPGFTSMGQDEAYYENLFRLESSGVAAAGSTILFALRDYAAALDPSDPVADDPGVLKSLLRDPSVLHLADRVAKMLTSPAQATSTIPLPVAAPRIAIQSRLEGFDTDHLLDIAFAKNGAGLGRVAALVGRNGVGKTQLLATIAAALSGIRSTTATVTSSGITSVLAVSFTAFDSFTHARWPTPNYTYCGILKPPPPIHSSDRDARPLSTSYAGTRRVDLGQLMRRLQSSLSAMRYDRPDRFNEWLWMLRELHVLEREPQLGDPRSTNIEAFVQSLQHAASGHQLLVLLATALAEHLEAGTIVLWDEPEVHLHPQALATMLRCLYRLLECRDAYALLATHSPVVLQQIPSGQVRVAAHMAGRSVQIAGYDRESFGESLGDIIQHAFGVDEDQTSFTTILAQLSASHAYDQILALFPHRLSLGARLALRSIASETGTPVSIAKSVRGEET